MTLDYECIEHRGVVVESFDEKMGQVRLSGLAEIVWLLRGNVAPEVGQTIDCSVFRDEEDDLVISNWMASA